MSRRAAGWLAWSLVVLSVALLVGGIALAHTTTAANAPELPYGGEAELDSAVLSLAMMLTFSVVGAVVASRHPRNTIGWIFCSVGLVVGLSTLAGATLSAGSPTTPSAHAASPRRRRGSLLGPGSSWYMSPRASCYCCSPTADCPPPAGGP